jgi:branched-chain amino acid transport system substrate-binding protein
VAGYCTEPAACQTGHDCRRAAGGGACVNGACVSTFPVDPACTRYTEPPDLLMQRADGPDAPVVIGGIFSLDASHDQALTDPVRLAVREINENGGLNRGQKIGVVFCDNGGPGDTASDVARAALNVHALDYLAGTLGVPYLVGPLTSADALTLIGELTKQSYPTVIISPSATSPALSSANATIKPGTPRLFWRTCPDDSLQGQVLAQQVIGMATPAISSVAVVYINDTYGLGLSQAFAGKFAGTTNLVPYPTTPLSPADLTNLAHMADATKSDGVMIIAEHGDVAVQIMEAMVGLTIATKPFFFTDGSMDSSLVDPTLPAAVRAILATAQGTAPANPSGPNYDVFNTNLMTQFGISGTSASFLAQAYDATYVGAYGVVYASKKDSNYDGLDVAAGLAHLEKGPPIRLGALDWPTGTGDLQTGDIDVDGTSGPLQFDPATGEAPGAILVWKISGSPAAFAQVTVVPPP